MSVPAATEYEYLHSAYEPNCEFVDGEVIERNVGEYPHSRLQGLLYVYFRRRRKRWGITPIIGQRIKVRPTKYLIPDICVIHGPEPTQQILTEPPLIWIEVLSSEDRPIRVQRKVRGVLEFGSQYVWVIDPDTLESYVATKQAQYDLADGVFRIEPLGIEVPLSQLEED
jgi:Uma2 family endonuclease